MTADEPRVRVTTNLAFGICLILLGTALILDRLQLVHGERSCSDSGRSRSCCSAPRSSIQSFQRVDATPARYAQQPSYGGHIFALGDRSRSSCRRSFDRGGFTARDRLERDRQPLRRS